MHTTRYCAVGSALLVAAVLAPWRFTPVAAATTIFSNSFDSQSAGALVTGTGANQFSGTIGASNLSVENTTVSSAPNALAVTVGGRENAYAYTQYSTGYTNHTLTFSLQLGTDFTVPHLNYLVLAQSAPITSSNVGKVGVIMPPDSRIRLDYFDSAGLMQHPWVSYAVPSGSWHELALRESVGAGRGSLSMLVDGTTVARGSNLDLGTQGVTWFGVGEEHAPGNSGIAGHLYIDDVAAASTT